ncbi:dephospho-CoA kinase [Butyrivibrio sp. AE3004]|uniref:dephospho-CoA kinase n=1 Tax=Butyrivibrio sp. AE3004 TaxID=1506994 RepID=UPI0004946ABA|nr:dephospho-CoA kinase [Butyrivibrio sp. AE3004]
MVKIIGVTGGVGAGKSTVLNYIKSICNCRIIFADQVANDLKLKGQSCYEPIVGLLSEDILSENGEIDKNKMAAKIFADEELIQKVNDILHPAVNIYISDAIKQEKIRDELDYLFIEAALLIENGYDKIVDELWYIYVSEDVRRQRLKASRGYSDDKINDIFKGQLKDDEFRKYADFVINNSGDESDMKRQIDLKLGEN